MSNGVGSSTSISALDLAVSPESIDSANQSFAGYSVTALTEDKTPAKQLPAYTDTSSLPEGKTLSKRSIVPQEAVEAFLLKEIASLKKEVQELKAALAASTSKAEEVSPTDAKADLLSSGDDIADTLPAEAPFSAEIEIKDPDQIPEPESQTEREEIEASSPEQPKKIPDVRARQVQQHAAAEKTSAPYTPLIQSTTTSEPEPTSLAAREVSVAENLQPKLTRPVPGMNKPRKVSIHKRRISALLAPINFLKRLLIGDSRKMHSNNDVLGLTANEALKHNPKLLDGEVDPQTQCYKGLKPQDCESFVLRGAKLKLIEQYKPQSDQARKFAKKHQKLTEFLDKPFEHYTTMGKNKKEIKVPLMNGNKLEYETIDLEKIVADAGRGEAAKKLALQNEVDRIKQSYPLVIDYVKNTKAKKKREALIRDLIINKADYVNDIKQARYKKLKDVLNNRTDIKKIISDHGDLFDPDNDGELPVTQDGFSDAYNQLKAKFKAADRKLGDAKSAKRKLELEEAFTFRKTSHQKIAKALDKSAEKVRKAEQEVVKLREARDLIREALHDTKAYSDAAATMLNNLG
ncbi:hypothetical protein [Candidatus Sororendozoicomonas aggregata]|uniref:hypothetical protein n=1 Tax=Candidatus Sororendozoicomonas aggregata TaxID=3073239 RepID=UPI002ED51EF7